MKPSKLELIGIIVLNILGLAAFFWPFTVPAAVKVMDARTASWWIFLILLLLPLGLLLFVELGRGGMGPKAIALIGVLGAAMVALRIPGFVLGFNAMFIIVLVAGNAFGPRFGFLLGAVGMFASGLFVGGLGPWLPFQMVATAWMGMGAGLLPRSGSWPVRIGALAVYGFVTGLLFGAVMNLYSWPFEANGSGLSWSPDATTAENLGNYWTFYLVRSLGWDMFRAIGNVVMVLILARPLLGSLDRAARRMHLEVRSGPNPLNTPAIRRLA